MSLLTGLGLAILVAINAAITVVATRFFRLQLDTTWAAAIYAIVFVPIVLVVSTILLSGVLGFGNAAGSREIAIVIAIVLPMSTGFAIDLFWLPSPEDVELPESA